MIKRETVKRFDARPCCRLLATYLWVREGVREKIGYRDAPVSKNVPT